MAPTSPDVSILNSTLRLFTFLDLNDEQPQQHHHHHHHQQQDMQNMEDMDIDQVMEVPDTPERLVGSKTNCGEYSSSVVGVAEPSNLVDNGSTNLSRNQSRSFVRHGKNRFSIRDETSRINHNVISVSDSPSHFPRSSHGRRTMGDQISRKSETRLSTFPQGHDGSGSAIDDVLVVDVKTQDRNKKRVLHRGNTSCDTTKTTYAEVPSRSLACKDDDNVLYSTVRSEYAAVPETVCSRGSSQDIPSKEIRKRSIGCSSRTSKASSNVSEEKTPVDVSYTRSGASLKHAILTDFSQESMPKAEKIMLRSPITIIPTRTTGQRRLVRNGCISPHNIAQSKQTGESHANCPKDAGTTSSEIHIVSPNSEGNQFVGVDKKKGKGVMIGSSPTKQYGAKTINFSDRRSLNSKEVASGIRDAGEDDIGCSKTVDGWRSTHNRSKITSSDLSDEAGYLSGRVDDVAGHVLGQTHENRKRNVVRVSGKNTCPETDIPQVRDLVSPQHGPIHLVQDSPSTMFELSPENSRNSGRYKLTKRQRRPSLPRSNLGECSSSGFDDSDITCLWSSQEPANARSTRSRDLRHRGISGPIIEIDEFSPEIRCRNPEDTSQPVNGDLDARASQVEADELLARQLQEQLYHETQGVGSGEIDAGLAWTLQQQENAQRASLGAQHASLGGQHALHRRDPGMSHLYRQYTSESIPSPSIRSRTRARGSPFSRTARLRNTPRHSSTLSFRERNSRFPPNVDIETRIHILEALEAAVGNHNNMPMGSHFFQVQRDFNENDYEMLLALDEDNHRHVGASVHQINSLPQSTVQTDNFEETCAICLENPTIGETIRHLPCLHKFHKDCIDSWLRRSTACPICKSSIT